MDSTIELRRAGLPDAPSIRRLVDEAYAKWIPIVGGVPEPLTRNYEALLSDHSFWVYCPHNRITAMLELIQSSHALHIANLVVAPHSQGRGIGSAMLRYAEVEAEYLGLSEIHLCLNREMQTNRRFYERRGYTFTHCERIDDLDIEFMAKYISDLEDLSN